MANRLIDIGSRTKLLRTQIVLLEANINYTLLYLADGQKIIVSYHLGKLQKRLSDFNEFIRPNRNIIVNMNYVTNYDTTSLNIIKRKVLISRRRKDYISLFFQAHYLKNKPKHQKYYEI